MRKARLLRRNFTFGLALSMAASALSAAAALAQTPYPDKVKVGAVLNLSGSTASQGEDFRVGLQMAADQWNEKGGIGGSKIEMIFEDHATQPAKAVTAAQKLIQVDGVKLLANVYTSPVLAVVPIAEKARVLQISAGATSPRLRNVSKYFMANVANAALEVDVLLSYAMKRMNAKKISVIYSNDDFGNGMRDAVKDFVASNGGTLVVTEGIEPAKADLAAVSAKLMAANPDVIYLALAGVGVGSTVKQLRENGFFGVLLGHQGFDTPEMRSVSGKSAENSFWTAAAVSGRNSEEAAFSESYKKLYRREPSVNARNHYDLGMSVFQAMENLRKDNKEWTAENIRSALIALGTYSGVQGTFSYLEDGTALRQFDIKTMNAAGEVQEVMSAAEIQAQGIFSFKSASK